MKRTTLAASAFLTLGLLAPATPAMAGADDPRRDGDRDHRSAYRGDRDDDGPRWHKRHFRGFVIRGTIEAIDPADNELTVDLRRSSRDITVEALDRTRVWRDGERADFDDLESGDVVRVKGVKKKGDRYALRIVAASPEFLDR